jgi:hypothetical protein
MRIGFIGPDFKNAQRRSVEGLRFKEAAASLVET